MASIKDIGITGNGKVVGRDDNSVSLKSEIHNYPASRTKLSVLFDALKEKFENGEQTDCVSEELKFYQTERDTIGLEQKLKEGDLDYLFEDASFLKEAYTRKLYKYQLYEPAQEIHTYILGIICSKFRYLIYPLLKKKNPQDEISKIISSEIVDPIMTIILEQGCSDVMGLTYKDIEGMIYFLTGRCHIKWRI
ncbi:ABC-three component system protein [Bacteroides sp. 51]|uniref:ABC-three component system protein n=1 Tax=Bacteroides sp. 51 TaxID=2302938 RepID=UPI0019402BDE|nr:ABC-three component system protein [Bacteroides sp. 51]